MKPRLSRSLKAAGLIQPGFGLKTLSFLTIIALLSITVLAACSPTLGVLEAQIVPAQQVQAAGADLSGLKPAVIAILFGDPADRRALIRYQPRLCRSAAGAPSCRSDEPQGSQVHVFPVEGTDIGFLRPDEIGQYLDFNARSLFAVYSLQPLGASAELGLLFAGEQDGESLPVTAFIQDGWLTRLEFHYGMQPAEVLGEVPLGQILLDPAEAQTWSQPLAQWEVVSQWSTSPDQRWNTYSMVALPPDRQGEYYRRLIVVSADSLTVYPAAEVWAQFEAGYEVPFPLEWTKDGTALFWTHTRTPDGCAVFSSGSDLHRLDLNSGQSTRLLESVGSWLALSPDEGRVAAVSSGRLAMIHLGTLVERSVDLPDGQPGQVVWSPDGRSLALAVARHPCADSATSVLRVDVDSLQVTPLLTDDLRGFAPQSWSLLGSLQVAGVEGTLWQMDPATGELWQGDLPLPSPSPAAAGSPDTQEVRFYLSTVEPADRRTFEMLAEEFNFLQAEYRLVFTPEPTGLDNLNYNPDVFLAALNATSDCFSYLSLPGEYQTRSERLLDLASFIAGSFLEDYYPAELALYQPDGVLTGLPFFEWPELMAYNADLLAGSGLRSPEADWSFADFVELASAAVQNSGGGPVYGFVGDDTNLRLLANGLAGRALITDTNPPAASLTGPEMTQAVGRLNELRRTRALLLLRTSLFADADVYAASSAWLDGRVAFWTTNGMSGGKPAWSMEEAGPGFQVGYAPLPLMEGVADHDLSYFYSLPRQSFFIFKDSPAAQGCWDWFSYVSDRSGSFSAVPSRRSLSFAPSWTEAHGPAAPILRTAMERLYAPGGADLSRTNGWLYTWQLTAVRSILDGAEPGPALAEAQRKAEIYLACLAPSSDQQLTPSQLDQLSADCSRQADPTIPR